MTNPFNIQFPNLSNNSNGGIPPSENDSYNLGSSMLDSNDQNRNKEAFISFYEKSEEEFQEEDNSGQNEDNLQNQAINVYSGKAQIINVTVVSKEDFVKDINIGNSFTSFNFVFGNENEGISFENLDMLNNQSSTEQRSTSINSKTLSQPVNSETNETRKGENKDENNNGICNEICAYDPESNVEVKEQLQKFDSIKDSNAENLNSEKIKSKNIEPNKDIISYQSQNNQIIVGGVCGNNVSSQNYFGNINKINISNKNENMEDLEKSDSSIENTKNIPFRIDLNSMRINPIEKENYPIISPNMGQDEFPPNKVFQQRELNGGKIETKDDNTFNNTQNNLINSFSGISSNIYDFEIGNIISSTDKSNKNDSLHNLLNKKRKRKAKKIFKSTKFPKILEDKKKLNLETKGKFFVIKNNIELKQESKVALNSSAPLQINSMKNDKITKQIEKIKKFFSITEHHHISTENPDKNKLIKKKRDEVERQIKTELTKLPPGDIEKYNYRKFKKYLKFIKKDDDKNNFLDAFFAPRSKGDPLLKYNLNGQNFEFKSYSQELMTHIFSIDGISDLYEIFLNDEDYEKNNKEEIDNKKNNKKNNKEEKGNENLYIYKFYGKNIHKIYCDKYKESHLDLVVEKKDDE